LVPSQVKRVQMAVSAITIYNDQILLVRRSPAWPEQWAPPGGKVEPNERVVEALRRETQEEIGIDLHPLQLVAELELHTGLKDYVIIAFLCDVIANPGSVRAASDALQASWVPFAQAIRLPLAPGVRQVLNKLHLR